MTISIQISVNGNYKVPVTAKQGDGEATTTVVSGRGHSGPNIHLVHFSHGPDALTLTIGPESPDHGEVAHDYRAETMDDSGGTPPPPPPPAP